MKTFAALFLFIAFCSTVKAQAYQPFVVEGAHWEVHEAACSMCDPQFITANHIMTYWFKLEGDVTLNGLTYKKLYRSEEGYWHPYMGPVFTYCVAYRQMALVREDTVSRKVYFIGDIGGCLYGISTDTLLFDFSKNTGDTIDMTFNDPHDGWCTDTSFVVDSVNNKGFKTYSRRTSYMHSTAYLGFMPHELYEGIGPNWGLFGGPKPDFEGSYSTTLVNYCVGPDSLCGKGCIPTTISELPETNSFKIYPNPATDVVTIESDELIIGTEIQDVLGRTLITASPNTAHTELNVSSLPKGYYFVRITTSPGITQRRILIE